MHHPHDLAILQLSEHISIVFVFSLLLYKSKLRFVCVFSPILSEGSSRCAPP